MSIILLAPILNGIKKKMPLLLILYWLCDYAFLSTIVDFVDRSHLELLVTGQNEHILCMEYRYSA